MHALGGTINVYGRHPLETEKLTSTNQVILTNESEDNNHSEPVVTLPATHRPNPAELEKLTRVVLHTCSNAEALSVHTNRYDIVASS